MQGRIGVGGSGVGGGPHNLRLQDTEAPPPLPPNPTHRNPSEQDIAPRLWTPNGSRQHAMQTCDRLYVQRWNAGDVDLGLPKCGWVSKNKERQHEKLACSTTPADSRCGAPIHPSADGGSFTTSCRRLAADATPTGAPPRPPIPLPPHFYNPFNCSFALFHLGSFTESPT